jgi:hypothetical protein
VRVFDERRIIMARQFDEHPNAMGLNGSDGVLPRYRLTAKPMEQFLKVMAMLAKRVCLEFVRQLKQLGRWFRH